MEFYLQPALLAPPCPMKISEVEYHDLVRARQILNAAFSLEENYDLLIGNYIELENSALKLCTTTMVQRRFSYDDLFELTSEMNRRAVNFLSSARLFVDQIGRRAGICGLEKTTIKEKLAVEYDGSFEYRFMEAVRNHVQHSGSAVHSLSYGGQWWPDRENRWDVYSIGVFTQKQQLALDASFKKNVLNECPDKVDFLKASRHYLESLSKVHSFSRSSIDNAVTRARSSFETAIHQYSDFSGASTIALSAFSKNDGGREKPTAIFLEWDDVRLKLVERNKSLHHLSKCVVSSVTL